MKLLHELSAIVLMIMIIAITIKGGVNDLIITYVLIWGFLFVGSRRDR